MSTQTQLTPIKFRNQKEVDAFVDSIRIQMTGQGFDYTRMNPQYLEQDESNYYVVFRNLAYKVKRLE